MKKTYEILYKIFFIIVVIVIPIVFFLLIRGPKVEIKVDGQYLIVEHNFDFTQNRDSKFTVVWETDAGTLSSAEPDTEYKAPTDNKYYLYSALNERIKWDLQDEDGFNYKTATIQVTVFEYTNDRRYSKSGSEVYTDTITVSYIDGKITRSEERNFGNPVRDNADDDWQQILVLDKQGNYVTLRYRYGKELGSSDVVAWKSNVKMLYNAEFGDAPIYNPNGSSSVLISDSTTICFDLSEFDDMGSGTYSDSIEISAFVTDKKNINEQSLNLSLDESLIRNQEQIFIDCYSNKDNCYTIRK